MLCFIKEMEISIRPNSPSNSMFHKVSWGIWTRKNLHLFDRTKHLTTFLIEILEMMRPNNGFGSVESNISIVADIMI